MKNEGIVVDFQQVQRKKLRENPTTSIAVRQCLIHTYESITPFGLQSFFIHNKNIVLLQWKKLLNPTLTSLEEVAWALFIQKTGDPTQGGANPKETNPCSWRRFNQCWSEAELILPVNWGDDWADTSTHILTHQSTELPGEPTHVEERERGRKSA